MSPGRSVVNCHESVEGMMYQKYPGKATIIGWLVLWMKSLPTLLPPGKAKSSKAIRETLVMLALFSDGRRWIKGGFHYQRWSCFINVHGQWLVCSAGNRAGCQLPEFLFVSQDAVGLWREHVNNALFPPYVPAGTPQAMDKYSNTAVGPGRPGFSEEVKHTVWICRKAELWSTMNTLLFLWFTFYYIMHRQAKFALPQTEH